MAAADAKFGFLRSRYALALTAILAVQTAGLHAISRQEQVPLVKPLRAFPAAIGGWRLVQENPIEAEVMEVLRADDVLSRTYAGANGNAASLFIAYFKSQRTGQAPHSPKNCLPGSGWEPSESGTITIRVPGRSEPIRVNKYLVSKGDATSVVLYWYQSHNRVIASEYSAKIHQVVDAIRYNRTDTALVRVVAPSGEDPAAATGVAKRFVQAFFSQLGGYLPS